MPDFRCGACCVVVQPVPAGSGEFCSHMQTNQVADQQSVIRPTSLLLSYTSAVRIGNATSPTTSLGASFSVGDAGLMCPDVCALKQQRSLLFKVTHPPPVSSHLVVGAPDR